MTDTTFYDQLNTLRRKRDQAWEMAGLARQDGDTADELKRTAEAREYQMQISALLDGGAR